MSCNKKNILEHDFDKDKCTNAFDDLDVDEIVEEMIRMCNNESKEYR